MVRISCTRLPRPVRNGATTVVGIGVRKRGEYDVRLRLRKVYRLRIAISEKRAMSKAAPPGTRHTESDVERRVQVAFSVAGEKLQNLLPAKWRSASLPPGPSEGANF